LQQEDNAPFFVALLWTRTEAKQADRVSEHQKSVENEPLAMRASEVPDEYRIRSQKEFN